MEGQEWDRREEDRKARQEISSAIERLEDKIDARLDNLAERVNELDEFLRGGPSGQDPLGTRVHLLETGLTEIKILVKGDALGRGSLIELTKRAVAEAEEAKKIAEGRVEVQTTRRGQNVSIIVAVVSVTGVITMAAFSNWDKIHRIFQNESPTEQVERLRKEIEAERKNRGPRIQKLLREIDRANRRRS